MSTDALRGVPGAPRRMLLPRAFPAWLSARGRAVVGASLPNYQRPGGAGPAGRTRPVCHWGKRLHPSVLGQGQQWHVTHEAERGSALRLSVRTRPGASRRWQGLWWPRA